MTIRLSDYLAKRLKEHHKVEHFFMVSGGGAMYLNDSLGRHIAYTCNHSEQACAFAAEGYARLQQKMALVNVTTGPGGLNTLNGVFGQWTDSVPVLYISGQVKFNTSMASCPNLQLRQLGDQEVDIIRVVSPLVKYAQMITDPSEVQYHLDRAVYEATHGRFGPVWLDIPMNVQSALIEERTLKEFNPPDIPQYDFHLKEVVGKLQSAKRPLIVVGHGVRLSGQINTLFRLLEKLDLPVVTTLNGFDILPSTHKNYVGRIGTIGQRAGNFVLQNADVVLCLGTRNNIRQASYNYENFAKNAFKIVVDVDQAELDKPTVIPDLKVNADLGQFLPELADALPELSRPEWLEWCKMRQSKYDFALTAEYQQDGQEINIYSFIHSVIQRLEDNDICVMANASATICTFQTAEIKRGQRIFSNSGDASMGYDLPTAIGACIAGGKRNTVCFAGDGSIMMNVQELQTIKHHHLPIRIFIINNDGYISIQQTHKNFFEGKLTGCSSCSGVSMPDFIALAQGFGIRAVSVKDADKVDKVLDQVFSAEGPIICNVIVKPGYSFSPKLATRVLADGSLVSPSLEDMAPFLSAEEHASNVIKT